MPAPANSLPARPRIKPIFDVLYLDGRVHLGSGVAYASEIEDESGRWASLVRLLDGTRTVDQLRAVLAGQLDATEVTEGLTTLLENGFLEDAAEPVPPELSDRDLERYKANLNFFRYVSGPGASCYTPQVLLKQTRVTVFGMGGIGSNVCMALAELGVGHIEAVDFDKVELSNLNRQVLYSTSVIGQPKAEAAAQRMKEFNPDIEFVTYERRLTSQEDVNEVVAESAPDFMFSLADKPNGYFDFWTNTACVRRGIPFAAANVASGIGTAFTVVPGAGPCYQCRVDDEADSQPQQSEMLEYVRQHQLNATNGALGPACMLLAYFLSYEFLRYRTGISPMLTQDRLLEVNFVTFDQTWHDFARRADCPVCGS